LQVVLCPVPAKGSYVTPRPRLSPLLSFVGTSEAVDDEAGGGGGGCTEDGAGGGGVVEGLAADVDEGGADAAAKDELCLTCTDVYSLVAPTAAAESSNEGNADEEGVGDRAASIEEEETAEVTTGSVVV
jgi:hypothetical protein